MNLHDTIKMTVEGCGLQLYDIVQVKENNNNIFRVLITSKDGVTLDQCAQVSHLLSPILDVDEPMNGNYNLEVSSPGIERKLKTKEHYQASIGENVKVKDIATEVYKGKLLDADDKKITVETEFGKEEIEYDMILSGSTYFQW